MKDLTNLPLSKLDIFIAPVAELFYNTGYPAYVCFASLQSNIWPIDP